MGTVAITGATGFIGQHVIPLLLARGYNVRAMTRSGSDFPSSVEPIIGDVRDAEATGKLVQGCELVIHLAGQAHTDLKSEAERESAVAVNVGGARNLFEACRKHGVGRIVLASSAHVYQGQEGVNLREDAPIGAENLYAQTKIDLETLASDYGTKGLNVVIGRPCLTYGPGARFNLLRLMEAIHRGRYFHVGHLDVQRSFCSAYSAAAALVYLAEKGAPGEAYNIADEKPSRLEDFTNDLADRMECPRPRRLPYALTWGAAAAFSAAGIFGVRGPLTLASLKKLTDSFTLSVDKLTRLGFTWPDSGERGRQEMVNSFLAARA